MFKITFWTGCEILFRRILRRGQRVPCWLRVYLRTRVSFFGGWGGTTKPARSIWTYFVSKMFYDYIILWLSKSGFLLKL